MKERNNANKNGIQRERSMDRWGMVVVVVLLSWIRIGGYSFSSRIFY